jgi:hypothetical protein
MADQGRIIEVLNRHIFAEEKAALIEAITSNPDRFVGVFRSTTPRLKLLQNLLQSREIRFGDAIEEVIRLLLADMGFVNLPLSLTAEGQDDLSCDQYFHSVDKTRYYLVEQKVRDDHDSTKKRGQIANFRRKVEFLKERHGSSLVAVMYFIDPSLHKNEAYYAPELSKMQSELQIQIHLFYNGEFFQYLERHTRTWELLLNSLQAWRETVPEQITLNFDAEPDKTLVELKAISGGIWHKFIINDLLWSSGVVHTLFPAGVVLSRLHGDFLARSAVRYRFGKSTANYGGLADLLKQQIKKYYPDLGDALSDSNLNSYLLNE